MSERWPGQPAKLDEPVDGEVEEEELNEEPPSEEDAVDGELPQLRTSDEQQHAYGELDIPFRQALFVLAEVIHSSPTHAVANAGLKSFGMDHGNPTLEGGHQVFIVSDEHVTFLPSAPVKVGELVRFLPGHIDPTVAYHERMHLIDGEDVVETWPVDLRGW